jgi:GTP-binding protein
MKLVARESLPQARGAPLVTVAAQSGVGLDRVMKAVEEAHEDWTARVKTKDLNEWLYATIARHPPPAVAASGSSRAISRKSKRARRRSF